MKTVEFGSLFHFICNGMNVKQDKSGDGLPITRIETISNATIDADKVGYAGLSFETSEAWLLQPGDILFSHINSVEHIGKCAVYEGVPEHLVHGMNLLCLRCDQSKILPTFAKYLIRGANFRAALSCYINKAVNQASISIGNLKGISVRVPSLPEQHRIAVILDNANALRVKCREAMAQLDRLAQSIFVEMFGDPVANPNGWPVVEFEKEATVIGGYAFKSGDYTVSGVPLIRIGDVNRGGFSDNNACFLPNSFAEVFSRFLIYPGDLLMSLTGTTGKNDYGNVTILTDAHEKYFLNQRVACIKPMSNRVTKEYLFHFLSNEKIKSKIISRSRGVRQANISNSDILELALPLPPTHVQLEFSKSLQIISRLSACKNSSLKEFDALFKSLQHQAFRGEL